MFRIKLTSKAEKDLKKISKAHQIIIGRIFEELKEDPLIGKPLTREMTGRLSYRVSIYRIVYKVNFKDEIIFILTAGHRANVYN